MQELAATDVDGKRLRRVRGGAKLASGGEGTVYEDMDRSDLVLKILHTPNQRGHDKILAMLLHRPDKQIDNQGAVTVVQIAWPQEVLVELDGRFVGFSMRRVDFSATVPLNAWFDRLSRAHNRLTTDDRIRVYLAHNLAAVVEFVHKVGHAIVDVKPENIRGYRQGGFVCLLDCDGFLVRHGATVYPASVATRSYTAPEHLSGVWRPETFGQSQDEFGLAVMIFMLLNDGRHPSSGTSNGPPNDHAGRLAQGMFFLDSRSGLVPPAASQHEFFHAETLAMFRRAFGASTSRPSATDWRLHLRETLGSLVNCTEKAEHWHYGQGCAWCELERRNNPPARIQISAPPSVGGATTPIAISAPVSAPTSNVIPAPKSIAVSASTSIAISAPRTATISKTRKPSGLQLPKWMKVYGAIGLGLIAIANFRSNDPAPAPAPQKSPPTRAPAPAPPPQQSPPTRAPAPVIVFRPRWGVASIQAVLRQTPDPSGKPVTSLNRATLLEQLDSTDTFVKVRSSDGTTGWVSKEVVVNADDVSRLNNITAQQYIQQRLPEKRVASVRSQAMASQGSMLEIAAQITARSPEVVSSLERLDDARRIEIDVDAGAATWFGWAARAADREKKFDAAYTNSWAALEADPLNAEHYRRLGISAHHFAQPAMVHSIAGVLPYLSPKSATTWAIVGLAQAADPKISLNIATGSFVLVFKLADPKAARTLLSDLLASSSDPRVQAAINNAFREVATGGAASPLEPARQAAPAPPQPPTQLSTPVNIQQTVAPLLQRGEDAFAKGNYAQAKVNASTVLTLDPDNARGQQLLERARQAERQVIERIPVR